MRCEKKVFASRTEALAHNKGQTAYVCRECGHWHLTSGIAGRINKAKLASDPLIAREWIIRHSRRKRSG